MMVLLYCICQKSVNTQIVLFGGVRIKEYHSLTIGRPALIQPFSIPSLSS